MRQLISDDAAHDAFDKLRETIEPGAAARGMRTRAEHMLKVAKARAVLKATGGTVAEREAQALLSPEVTAAMKAEADAVEQDEFFRNQRNTCTTIIDGWRTEQSSIRALGKIG